MGTDLFFYPLQDAEHIMPNTIVVSDRIDMPRAYVVYAQIEGGPHSIESLDDEDQKWLLEHGGSVKADRKTDLIVTYSPPGRHSRDISMDVGHVTFVSELKKLRIPDNIRSGYDEFKRKIDALPDHLPVLIEWC